MLRELDLVKLLYITLHVLELIKVHVRYFRRNGIGDCGNWRRS